MKTHIRLHSETPLVYVPFPCPVICGDLTTHVIFIFTLGHKYVTENRSLDVSVVSVVDGSEGLWGHSTPSSCP